MAFTNQIENFRINMQFWRVFAIWPVGISNFYYKHYMRAFIFIFVFVYIFLFTINFYFVPIKMDIYIESLIFYFTIIASVSKALTIYFKHDEINHILNVLQSDSFRPKTEKDCIVIKKAKTFNRRYYLITLVVSLTSHLTHVISPLAAHVFASAPLLLPVCSYAFLPEDFIRKYKYPIYFYQVIGLDCCMWYNVNIDTFFLGLLILTIAQLDILDSTLRKVTDAKEKQISKIKLHEAILIKQLNDSFKHFNEIGKFCMMIQKVFGITLFIQFSMASAIICICLIRFTLPASIDYLIFLSSYMFIMIIQILVPCWFGTRIIDKSSLLSQALYDCDWIARSRTFKINMRLFVERTKCPLAIMGWTFFLLSLSTFTSIINTAYSFFTLLRHMQSRQ